MFTSEWLFGLLNRKKDRDTSIVPLPFALSPQADKLLLHEQLHNDFRTIRYRGAGTEDGGVAADIFGHRTHKVGYGKVGNGKDAKE